MSSSVSYRLDARLKEGLAARAAAEGTTESALVSRLLTEGLKTAAHPGVVYRGGPSGRRAGLAGGPDLWEVLLAVRHAPGREEEKIAGAADQMGVATHLVRLAVEFAAEYPDEIESRIAANEMAAERASRLAAERAQLIAS